MPSFNNPRKILITGASSGIGAALALAYARPGNQLYLGGRERSRLYAISAQVRDAGADCETRVVDVTEPAAMHDWIAPLIELDLIIANAGISASTRKKKSVADIPDTDVFATNVDGVVNTISPAISNMLARRHGQVALMSSLASFRAFRDAPAYCASKAAVRFYGAGLRRAHAANGLGVSVICPGFVRSPMTAANTFTMPLLMDADKAATLIRRKLARNKSMISFPLPMYLAVRLLALL